MKQYYIDETTGNLVVSDDCNYIMLVLTSSDNNNNKFYELTFDGSKVNARYGRVGYDGVTTYVGDSHYSMVSKAKSKFKKGYKPLLVENNSFNNKEENNKTILECAKKDLVSSDNSNKDILYSLINYLVESNKHEILSFSSGQIKIDDNGLVKTALGIISLENILEAEKILLDINKIYENKSKHIDYKNKLDDYLTLIPQKVPHSRGWADNFFSTFTSFEKQFDFLEQLKTSVIAYHEIVEKEKNNKSKNNKKHHKIFDRKISLVTDDNIISYIKDYFYKTINSSHPSSKLRLINVYELIDEKEDEIFNKKSAEIGNVHQYWHGTRTFNLLSILKSGLVIPKSNGFNVTGRMFGDGVYFSGQSTKALNYSYGVWGGTRDRNNIYMFLADVAMGKTFNAFSKINQTKGKNKMYPVKGYHSTYAKGGKLNIIHDGGIYSLQNDEMIVYDLSQIRLRYLCEFK